MQKCFFLWFVFSYNACLGQEKYEIVFNKLAQVLSKENPIPFKDIVFLVENCYYDNSLSKADWNYKLTVLVELVVEFRKNNRLNYDKGDSNRIRTYAAIFKVLTDTTTLVFKKDTVFHLPFEYDFNDIFGNKDWSKMFIAKLLDTHKGNCHSMPYLYKILCEALDVPCHLALAPNHIYVKHRSDKAGWYNTELTSASFPIDAWLMASGYITLQAIQNGIYMDALNDKQCIAFCVLDLAKGFDRKYPGNDGTFILKCCDLTLEHFPKCINAMLFKAETRKKQLERLMKTLNVSNPARFRLQPEGQKWWEEMNGLYTQIHRLGYRTMPEPMYVDWLLSLQKEREKYANKQMIDMHK